MLSKLKIMRLKHFKNPIENSKNFLLSKPNRFNFVGDILKKISNWQEPEKWVFVIGCYNSGTTLLQKLISQHDKVSSLYEGVFKTKELITPEELGWTRLWYKVVDQVRLNQNNKNINIKELKKDWGLFLDKNKPIYLEKSIVNSARMTWLQKNFKNSYFIFIVRNGYAVSEGIKRKASGGLWGIQKEEYKPTYPIEFCAKQWVINNKVIEKDSKSINNFKKIYYEDLCENPDDTLKDIFEFLEMEPIQNKNMDRKWNIHDKESEIINMNNKSFKNLDFEEIKKIEEIAGEMLEFYNYDFISQE